MSIEQHNGTKRHATPLWVISIFITLTEVVVGGVVTQTDGVVQILFTVFAIIFPTFISIAFFYILWNRPHHLFSPTEYGQQVSINEYVSAMKQTMAVDETRLYDDIKQTITQTLKSEDMTQQFAQQIDNTSSTEQNQKIAQALDYAVEQTVEHVKEHNFISIDTRPLLPEEGERYTIAHTKFKTAGDLLDYVWLQLQAASVPPFTYEKLWILKNADTHQYYTGLHAKIVNGKYQKDRRQLSDIGINPGTHLVVEAVTN